MKNWQHVIRRWIISTLGAEHFNSTLERSSRFFEEASELVQSTGLRKELAQAILDEVYVRQAGEVRQEFGGAMVTLLALAENQEVSALDCLIAESTRIHTPEIIAKCQRRSAEKKEKGLGI